MTLKIMPNLEFKRQLDIYSKRIQIMSVRESEVNTALTGERMSISYHLKPIEREQKNNFLLKSFGQKESKNFKKIKLKNFNRKEYKHL